MTRSALFEINDFEPLKIKIMRCAACIGSGCARCSNTGRFGSSIWRGNSCLSRITSAEATA